MLALVGVIRFGSPLHFAGILSVFSFPRLGPSYSPVVVVRSSKNTRLDRCPRLEGGSLFFLYRTLGPFWFRLEQVEEDEVQAAIMPPAPGLVLVMMGSVSILMGF